jgi:hypothetical protein
MNSDESVVIISAMRYMLGRSSYGVGCVIDYIKSKKDELTESNKSIIERDIMDFIAEHPYSSHESKWLELIKFIK